MIRVHVPATSANLGVGYDCLGLALAYEGIFSFSFPEEGITISGCPKEFQNKDNLVLQSFFTALEALGVEEPKGIHLDIQTPVPVARGLGSSASCIVAGVLAGAAYSGQTLSKEALLRICLLLEHHPDNVAPALYGNLCASFIDEEEPITAHFQVHERFRFVTIIPDYEVRTADARAILPDTMHYAEATYQMGRCSALCKALETGDGVLLRHACKDRMQEPYRKKLIKDYEDVRSMAYAHGAETFFISGSGSTMIAVMDQKTSEDVTLLFRQRYPNWIILNLSAAKQGGYVEYE